MPTHPHVVLGLLVGLLAGGVGCRVSEPQTVVEGHHELCCKSANADNLGFVGCRASSSCRTSERVWVRGPVTCEAPDEQRCAGGRCCRLDLEALALLEIDPASAVIEHSDEDPPVVEPAPEPAAIVPVPLDWQARPTPVSIPKLVCPATVERGVVGTVVVDVEVDESGRVTEAVIRSGIDPQCDALARDALLHAEFEPARTPSGQAMASSLVWEYEFSRDNEVDE